MLRSSLLRLRVRPALPAPLALAAPVAQPVAAHSATPARAGSAYLDGPGTTLHVYSLLTRCLTTNLPAGPR